MNKEIRATAGPVALETRADGAEDFVGEAIVFGQTSELLGGQFREVIAAEALDGADMTDVVGLFNHDRNFLLGRSTSGTLTLERHAGGLRYRIPYDATDPDHVRVRAKVLRGDVRGSSFAFVVADNGAVWTRDRQTGAELRTVTRIALLDDVSLVVSPAYLQSSAALSRRTLDALSAERDAQLPGETADADPLPTEGPTDQASRELPADAEVPAWQVQVQHLTLQLDQLKRKN